METPENSFHVTISVGTIVKAIIIGLLIYTALILKDVVLVLVAAIVVASSIEPAILWFRRKAKLGRVPAAVVTYLLIVFTLAVVLIFFLPNVLNEASAYLSKLPQNMSVSDLWSPVKDTGIFGNSSIGSISPSFSIQDLTSEIKKIVAGTGEGFFATAGVVFGGLLSFLLIVVLSFYLAVQEDGVGSFLRVVAPAKARDYVVDVWQRSQKKIGSWMQGQLLLGLLVGILVYLGLLILGIKHALLLATLAGLFEIIPVFGPILSAIPALLIATVDGGASGVLLVLCLYILIHQFENHLLYPLVVKKVVGISPIVVILALVIGGKLAGILGILLSAPMAAVVMEIYNDIEKKKKAAMELLNPAK
ncbi:MAG: AI-2E family transporter [Candidatus Taylorbacteria bacterium]|nr:AI-2E family transporter [Candidatus Taylorbacteria bacterium]